MADPDSARERMIGGAIDLFRRRGVAATSLADIVAHSGAPRGSVYHYFPDGKTQLASEATEHAGRVMGAAISGLVNTKGPVAALDSFVAFYRDQLVSSEFTSGCPVVAGALGAGESDGVRAAADAAFTSWEETLTAALWQQGLPTQRAGSLATLAISAIEGALVLARAQRSTRPLDRVGEELAALVGDLLGR
ncbi:TetR/AcrR family transcriptional regulator [Amycolatopsis sp. WAC 01416]|uniref:TetR/AcrR family transcriptional regulator n=1 Tax=Amycolatopsis sp. WAC 01416 TaxID=2203196 RepID=UPI001F24FF8F|nr:TetR/AcrR family transcriptional regulator [Amycolatopsis sp. WAC 01416]